MKQGLKLNHIATSYPQEIPLNGKEMLLAGDKSETINKSWDMLIESVYSRTGIKIDDGNWEVDFLTFSDSKGTWDIAFH